MRARTLLLLSTLTLLPPACRAQSTSPATATPASFSTAAQTALSAMRTRAEALHIGGVALIAFIPGDTLQSWTSSMLVVGRYKDLPTDTSKGSNLFAIVYAKAAQMADTLKDSGTATRPPMTGEFGWQGGLIARTKSGYLLAAFSGGKSEDDVDVARTGLTILQHTP